MIRISTTSRSLYCLLAMMCAGTIIGCDGGGSENEPGPDFHQGASSRPAYLGTAGAQVSNSDTYVLADVRIEHSGTIYTNTPVYDAVTGSLTTQINIPVSATIYSVEVGYDAQGRIVYNQYAPPPSGDPTRVSVDAVQSVLVQDNRISLYESGGAPVDLSEVGGAPLLSNVVNDPNINRSVITDGLVLSEAAVNAFSGSPGGASARSETHGTQKWAIETFSASSVGTTSNVEQTRVYNRVGSEYVLGRTESRTDESTPAGRQTSLSTIILTNVRWQNNTSKDNARRSGTSGTPPTPEYLPPPPNNCDPLDPAPDCGSTGGGGVSSGGGGTSSTCTTVVSGANVVYQHGLNSDATTWEGINSNSGVRGFLRCAVAVGDELVPSLASKGHQSHSAQTAELSSLVLQRTQVTGRDQFVFVGHSQGGLISRRVAQSFVAQGKSNLVRGVITVGTPHQGANVVRNLPALGRFGAAATAVKSQVVCRFLGGTCSSLYDAIRFGIDVQLGASSGTAAAADLVPQSGEIQAVNRTPESFRRFGIQHYIQKRWAFARVAGDGTSFGGRRAVAAVDLIVGASTVGAIFSFFTGHFGAAAALASAVAQIIRADAYYHRITAGGDRTDGVVEGLSQEYPRAERNIVAATATSHPGETKREVSAIEIRDVMLIDLQLPRR